MLLLALDIGSRVFFSSEATAAGKTQYKVVPLQSPKTQVLQAALDQYSAEGWGLVAIEMVEGHFIFKK